MNTTLNIGLSEDPEVLMRLGRIVMAFGNLEFKLDHVLMVLSDTHFSRKNEISRFEKLSNKLTRIEEHVRKVCSTVDIAAWTDLISDLRSLSAQRNAAFHGHIVEEDGRLVLLYWDKDQDKKLTSEERAITINYLEELLHKLHLRRRQLGDFTNDYSFREHGHIPNLPLTQDIYPRLRMYKDG